MDSTSNDDDGTQRPWPTPRPTPPLPSVYGNFEFVRLLQNPTIASNSIPPENFRCHVIPPEPPNDVLDHTCGMIHQMFMPNNWLGMTRHLYQQIAPALRLASILIQHPALLPWWIHVCLGERQETPSGWYLAASPRERDVHAAGEVLKIFQLLSSSIKFGFSLLREERYLPQDASQPLRSHVPDAMSFLSLEEFLYYCEGEVQIRDEINLPHIILHSQFCFSLEHLLLRQTPESQQDREKVHLRLAIALCHELAHVFFHLIWGANTPQPFHHINEAIAEVGFSWEMSVFGGRIQSIDHPDLVVAYYSSNVPYTKTIIPSWWVHLFFRKSVWQHLATYYTFGHMGILTLPHTDEIGYKFVKGQDGWYLCIYDMQTGPPFDLDRRIFWNLERPGSCDPWGFVAEPSQIDPSL